MDKVRACPKIKNGPTSLYACFWWELYNCGIIVCNTNIMLKYSLFSCIYTKIIDRLLSGSPFPQKTSTKIVQNITTHYLTVIIFHHIVFILKFFTIKINKIFFEHCIYIFNCFVIKIISNMLRFISCIPFWYIFM